MFARFREFHDWTGSVLQGWCQQQLFFFTQYRSYFTPNGWFAYEPQVLIRFCCPNEERSGADILSRWRTSPVTKPSECLLSSFPYFLTLASSSADERSLLALPPAHLFCFVDQSVIRARGITNCATRSSANMRGCCSSIRWTFGNINLDVSHLTWQAVCIEHTVQHSLQIACSHVILIAAVYDVDLWLLCMSW